MSRPCTICRCSESGRIADLISAGNCNLGEIQVVKPPDPAPPQPLPRGIVLPLALCLQPTVLNGMVYARGDLYYANSGDPGPSWPGWAAIPFTGELIGELERDMSYHPMPESGFEFFYKQGPRNYCFSGHDGIPVVTVYVQDEQKIDDRAPPKGVQQIQAGAFAGQLRWKRPTGTLPPVPGEYDYLRGRATIDQEATNRRDIAFRNAELDQERYEAQRLAQERQKEIAGALASIQRASKEQLPALIEQFTQKANAGDFAYSRLATLAQQVLGDLLTAEDDARVTAEAAVPAPPEVPISDDEAEKYSAAQNIEK
jgi:hypothetical protein